MNEIRKKGMEILKELKQSSAIGLCNYSVSSIFRSELVFWETCLKPWVSELDYLRIINSLLSVYGHDVSDDTIRTMLSQISKEIGFNRKLCVLDGRKRLRREIKNG
jgi:hypothetical protein